MLNSAALFKATDLPVAAYLPAIAEALEKKGRLVLRAEPGAGKTSLVPPALALEAGDHGRKGRILVLEPRRIAAVQACARDVELMSAMRVPAPLGTQGAIGYRVRGEAHPGSQIEFITTGIFIRMIQSDPGLEGVSTVIFDEFHERSLEADLALAFLLEVKELVPDLRIVLMSATIESGRTAEFLDAPQIDIPGRCFPVEDFYCPVDQGPGFARDTARAVADFAHSSNGGLLVFLPGAGEIAAVGRELGSIGIESVPLYASLSLEEQRRVLRPSASSSVQGDAGAGRRIILATSIAETSLTVPDIAAVADSGLARLTRCDPRTGLNRLVTERESKDRAEQRRGRAGRLRAGRCLRLWARNDVLPERSEPEILRTELSGFLLESSVWGISDPLRLRLLDEPPRAALESARSLLGMLGLLAEDGSPTPLGRDACALGLEPRLSVLAIKAAGLGFPHEGAGLAALLEEGIPRETGTDEQGNLELALERLGARGRFGRGGEPRYARIAEEAGRIENALLRSARCTSTAAGPYSDGGAAVPVQRPRSHSTGAAPAPGIGALLAAGFPDRVAKRVGTEGTGGLFQLPGGRQLSAQGSLGAAAWIVAAEADSGGFEGLKPGMAAGSLARARVFSGAALSADEALSALEPLIAVQDELEWEGLHCRVRRRRRAGAILLSETALGSAAAADVQRALAARIAAEGLGFLPWKEEGAAALLARMRWYGRAVSRPGWPDLSEAALKEKAGDWLCPFIIAGAGPLIDGTALRSAVEALIPADMRSAFNREAPARFELPGGGHSLSLDYEAALAASSADNLASPSIEARVEDFFGQSSTPEIAGRPLSLVLLSPARRPLQITSDLSAFWQGAWKDVRKELRGRYPKHDWPEDPAHALPPARHPPRH